MGKIAVLQSLLMADLGQLLPQVFQYVLQSVDFFAAQSCRLDHVGQHRDGTALENGVQELVTNLVDALGFGEVRPVEIAVSLALKVEDPFLH